MFSNHGALIKHQHEIEGINSRLDGIQAAILSAKLKYILDWNERRISHANHYNKLLSNVTQVIIPKLIPNGKHVFHLYVIRVKNRTALQSFLNSKGISTGIHYPTPLPFLKAYDYLKHKKEDFPVSKNHQNKILSLPIYPELTKDQIHYVVDNIAEFYN